MGDEASSSSSNIGETVVIDHGRRRSPCGYCKSREYTSIVHGLGAESFTVDDYQELLDRGWRRSGSFLYKPEMERTCCPSYTIRLKADAFVPSKEQVRVSKRMQRFLDGIFDVKKSDQVKDKPYPSKVLQSLVNEASSSMMVSETPLKEISGTSSEDKHKTEQYINYLSNIIDSGISACIKSGEFPSAVQLPKAFVKKVVPQAKKRLIKIAGDLLYTSNIVFQIVAALRRSQSEAKNIYQSQILELAPEVVAERLACSIVQQGELSGFSMKACNGHLNFYSATEQIVSGEVPFNVNASVQSCTDYGAKHCFMLNNSEEIPQPKRRKLEIRLKRSSFDPEEYALYRRYQIKVHNDKPEQVTESSYKRFLVDSPIIYVPPSSSNRTVPPCGFGSFHQQYVIDGKLVAVGVVDILPRCLSSKYLFWDPDLAFLSLGKYSALQEIGWITEAQAHCSSLQYYYLGFYIHSCNKMRYKAAYRPSELLCPLRYEWVPFDIARPFLDKKSYVILSDIATLQNGASSPSHVPDNLIEQPCIDPGLENESKTLNVQEEEMELDFEGSDSELDDDWGAETSSIASVDELNTGNVSNIVIGLGGNRMKFKDLQRLFGLAEKGHIDLLEAKLRRYMKVVGPELSERIVYAIN